MRTDWAWLRISDDAFAVALTPSWFRAERLTIDLTDDATGGCLLAMLSRLTPKLVSAIETADGWTVDVHNRVEEHGDTLGEACAKALLAVWGKS